MWRIGFGKADITPATRGIGLMGYGMLDNTAEQVATPLSARAMYVRGDGRAVAVVICELAFMTRPVRESVMAALAAQPALDLPDHAVLLAAQHTHSAPGGYSDSPFYNATIPGFQPEVHRTIVDGIVAAIQAAAASAAPATLGVVSGMLPLSVDIARNRRLEAYNRNEDVTPTDDARAAIDRTMTMLVARRAASGEVGGATNPASTATPATATPAASTTRSDDGLLGLVHWFAVHCTSIQNDKQVIHFDNKGYAAQELEHAYPGAIAAFAQGAAGDVTPNFHYRDDRPFATGPHHDDDQNAHEAGHAQAEFAAELLRLPARPLAPRLGSALLQADLGDVTCDPDLADGTPRRTAPGEIGMAMFFGTEEGPGLPLSLLPLQRPLVAAKTWLRRARLGTAHDDAQAPKVTWLKSAEGKLLGLPKFRWLPHFPAPERLARTLDQVRALGTEHPAPWTPQRLPVQLLLLGDVAIAAAPGEFTTVAGRRVRELVLRELSAAGIREVIFCGYANDYAGYITTPEEYDVQAYEGASTHFGRWTLPAYLTLFRRLARQLVRDFAEAEPVRPQRDAASSPR